MRLELGRTRGVRARRAGDALDARGAFSLLSVDREIEIRLTSADQPEIDLGEKLGVQKGRRAWSSPTCPRRSDGRAHPDWPVRRENVVGRGAGYRSRDHRLSPHGRRARTRCSGISCRRRHCGSPVFLAMPRLCRPPRETPRNSRRSPRTAACPPKKLRLCREFFPPRPACRARD